MRTDAKQLDLDLDPEHAIALLWEEADEQTQDIAAMLRAMHEQDLARAMVARRARPRS